MDDVAPDIVDVVPEQMLKIEYPCGASVDNGKELTPTQVKDVPSFSWDAEDGALYLLAMVDPDAPTREDQSLGEILHYLVVNIPGGDVSKGDLLFEYIGAAPPEKAGLHRYIFFVYKQEERMGIEHETVPKEITQPRISFSIKKYASEKGLGTPVAGNMFVAQFDDYVPIIHASFADY